VFVLLVLIWKKQEKPLAKTLKTGGLEGAIKKRKRRLPFSYSHLWEQINDLPP